MTESEAIAEIQQSRSRFQLERFVLGQHDTPEMRFYQLCLELQDMEYKLAHATLAVRRGEIEVARLRAQGDELADVDAEIAELELEQTRLAMIGAAREVAVLRDLFAELPHFTRAEIEQAQPDYWAARLTRQHMLQQAFGGHWAQGDAMLQAGLIQPTELEGGDRELVR